MEIKVKEVLKNVNYFTLNDYKIGIKLRGIYSSCSVEHLYFISN